MIERINRVIHLAVISPPSVKTGKLRLVKNIELTLKGFNCSRHHSSHTLWGVNYICFWLDYVNIINWFIPDTVCVAQRAQPGWGGEVKWCWTEFSYHCWWQVCDAYKMTLCFPLIALRSHAGYRWMKFCLNLPKLLLHWFFKATSRLKNTSAEMLDSSDTSAD